MQHRARAGIEPLPLRSGPWHQTIPTFDVMKQVLLTDLFDED